MGRAAACGVVAALVLATGGCGSCNGGPAEAEPSAHAREATRPNVVLFVVDTLRADRLSQYGHDRPTGKALRALASEATRFERAHAPSGWTVPSVASLMSGVTPTEHGLMGPGDQLPEERETIAEALSGAGWDTIGFSHNVNIAQRTGFAQGFDAFTDYRGGVLRYPDVSEMVKPAVEWLDREREPFLLYMQPMNVHGPYRVPKAHRADLLGRPPRAGFRYYKRRMGGIMFKGRTELREEVDDTFLTSLEEKYDTAVRYTLDQLGRVIRALREQDLYDDTLIIVTSDHGEELFDHGGFSHGFSLYGEVVRVPLLMKLPGQREQRVVKAPVSLLDIYPTLVELLDLDAPESLEGRSLLPLAHGDEDAAESFAARPLALRTDRKKRCVAKALQIGHHKLIHIERNYEGRRDATELYDLERDPQEHSDLSEAEPQLVQTLSRQLQRGLARAEDGAGRPDNVLDDLDEEALRSLGYIR